MIATHEPGQFSGDIDLLTGRPVIVSAVARGRSRIWRVPGSHLRALLNRVPSFGEKLMIAFTRRRELLSQLGVLGLRVVGPGRCRETNTVREFLYKNFVPFTWFDPETQEGQKVFQALGSPRKSPVIECGDGRILVNPSLQELARVAGIWRMCPAQQVDFAIVGAGPAGLTAAVYASSEGLSTLVLDRLGPGGQAGSSSRIENFIGFPAGLSGTELATRGVLQMLKFGARLVAPVEVEKLVPARSPTDFHILHLDCGAEIRCRVILLALGVHWRRLEANGSGRFHGCGHLLRLYDRRSRPVRRRRRRGRGCGQFGRTGCHVSGRVLPDAQVHLLVRRTLGPGMSEYLANRIRAAANVVVHEQTEIDTVHGDRRLEEITLKNHATPRRADSPVPRCSFLSGPNRPRPGCRRTSGATLRVICKPASRPFVRDYGRVPIAIRVPWRRLSQACWPPGIFAPVPPSASVSRLVTAPWRLRAPIDCSRSILESGPDAHI